MLAWKPMVVGLGVLVAGWALKTAYTLGYEASERKWQLEWAKQVERQAKRARQVSRDYQRQKAELDREWRENNAKWEQIIAENAVYRRPCMDDDGVRELNRIIGKTR